MGGGLGLGLGLGVGAGLGWAVVAAGTGLSQKLTVYGAPLGLGRGGAGAGVLRLEPDFLKLGFATGNWFEFGFCDWNLVLGWVGLEIDGLGRSTAAMTSNFYLCLS